MEKNKKKIIAGVAIAGGAGLACLLARRKPEEPPPGEGRVQGYVIAEETGAKIMNAEILVDDIFHSYTDHHGLYRTGWIQFGAHTITVKAGNYETATFPIILEESLMDKDLPLQPLSEAPADWTEGIEVQSIKVEPSIAYVGETVEIAVYIQYPSPLPLPADIHGSVLVNGTELTGQWTIDFRNPTLRFSYTPSQPGTYTVRAQDKSANFMVSQDIKGTYYSPFGSTRIPQCTEITIPNVPPFRGFEGGDYKVPLAGRYIFLIYWLEGQIEKETLKELLLAAYPSAWDPPDADVREWVIKTTESRTGFPSAIVVMATDYTCPPYWYSMEELAQALVVERRWYSTCGGGYCIPRIYCPYCGEKITGPSYTQGRSWDTLSFMRTFLSHIETAHPDHPLTAPAWF